MQAGTKESPQDFKQCLVGIRITPKRSNQLPPSRAEIRLYKNHRRVETAFSSLDRLGFSDRYGHKVAMISVVIVFNILAIKHRNC